MGKTKILQRFKRERPVVSPSLGGLGGDFSKAPTGSILYFSNEGAPSLILPGKKGQILQMGTKGPEWVDPPTIPKCEWQVTDGVLSTKHAKVRLPRVTTKVTRGTLGKPVLTEPIKLSHDELTDVRPDQHHPKEHWLEGAEHKGPLPHSRISEIYPDQHHPQHHKLDEHYANPEALGYAHAQDTRVSIKQINHYELADIGRTAHAGIDQHIRNADNPHKVSALQLDGQDLADKLNEEAADGSIKWRIISKKGSSFDEIETRNAQIFTEGKIPDFALRDQYSNPLHFSDLKSLNSLRFVQSVEGFVDLNRLLLSVSPGGVLIFSPGNYKISSPVEIPASLRNLTLLGFGPHLTFLHYVAEKTEEGEKRAMFELHKEAKVWLVGFSFLGNSDVYGVSCYSQDDVMFDGVNLEGLIGNVRIIEANT